MPRALIHHDTQFKREASYTRPNQHTSNISPLWKQKRWLLSVSPSLLATQALILLFDMYGTALRPRHLTARVNTYTVERTFCLPYKPGDSGSKEKKHWAGFTPLFSVDLHVLFFILMTAISFKLRTYSMLDPDLALLCCFGSCAVNQLNLCQDSRRRCCLGTGRQEVVVAPRTAAKTPWLLKARLGFQTVTTQPAFQDLPPAAHHTQSSSTLPPTKKCKLDNLPLHCKGEVYFNFSFQNLLSHCKLQVGLNKTFP